MGPDHTPTNCYADDSGIRCATSYAIRPGFQRIQQGAMAVQGRAQSGDQAPLAAIARVSAAKSETWSLVLCLRM